MTTFKKIGKTASGPNPWSGSRARLGGAADGFTLLEILVVLTIMIMLAAMVYPAVGFLNEKERGRITEERLREIRRAIVGDPDRFDEAGRRIIAGYVGDMEAWPDLWEAAPQVKESVVGTPPPFDPAVVTNPAVYYYRPSGTFVGKRWQWNQPYRRLTDDTINNSDHIGGLETENEGQPLGLWTDNPKGDNSEILDASRWKGPYLIAPRDSKPEDALHLAVNDSEYNRLEPAYDIAFGVETWEDGDYAPANGGENYDDKEKFRLMQTDDRLEDGWNRALRFFITADPDHTDGSIFWIISEGPDHDATYPAKGTYSDITKAWTVDVNDTMGKNYDPEAPYNEDNIVMKIYSHEWQAVFDALNLRKRQETEAGFATIRRALVGESGSVAGGFNSGFTGALCRWPRLFRWEGASWDDENEDSTPLPYTKGQPRGLWTRTPNSADVQDNLEIPSSSSPGIGWSGAFMAPPMNIGADEKLVDGWGREILFFYDANHDSLLVVSRGPDGRFDFGTVDANYEEPDLPTEAVDNTTYNPSDPNGYNADNVVMVIGAENWKPAWFTLEQLTVENATDGFTRAMLVYGSDAATGVLQSTTYTAGVDGTLTGTTWQLGGAAPGEAFLHTSMTAPACSGTRSLVLWNDSDNNNTVDTGEFWKVLHYNLFTNHGLEPRDNFTINTTTHFSAAP